MKRQPLILGLLGAASLLTFIDRMALAVTGPAIQHDLAIGPVAWGWILSAYTLAYSLFEVPSGILGDRFGYRREMARITLWWSVFTAATAWCRTAWQLAGARFLFGLGAAGAYPNITGVLGRILPHRAYARGQGMVWAAGRLGGMLAPLLLVPMQAAAGWRSVFVVLGVIGAVWALVWWMVYRDPPPEETAQGAHGGAAWRDLLHAPAMWQLALAYGCYAWGSWFFFSWFPVWLVRGGGFSPAQMAGVAALPFAVGVISNLVGGWLADRLAARMGAGRAYRTITGVCLILTALCLAAMGMAHGHGQIIVFSTCAFAVMDLMLPAAWAMCAMVGGTNRATAAGIMNTAGNLGGFMCTVAFGYIIAWTGNYALPVAAVAAMVALSAVLFARIDGLPQCGDAAG